MYKNKLQVFVNSSMMISLTTILSFIQINVLWINGGNITLLSMLPILFFSYKYGAKYGVVTCFVAGLIQFFLNMNIFKGLNGFSYFFGVILDYILAYMVLCFCGIFKRFHSDEVNFSIGCIFAISLRFICHFISGIFIWSSIFRDNIGAVFYSFTYNLSYMLPECIITSFGAYFLMKALKNYKG